MGIGRTGGAALGIGMGIKVQKFLQPKEKKKGAEMMEFSPNFSPKIHIPPHPSAQSQEIGILSQNPQHGTGNNQTTISTL